MRSSNKSRSRNKGGNRRNNQATGNTLNRVFDSSGPEGRVRGTSQQIVEKYSSLARDAHLSGDRVAAESFSQHSEHYLRMMNEAQHEQNARQAEHQKKQQQQQLEKQQRQQQQQQQPQPQQQQDAQEAAPQPAATTIDDEQPPMAAIPVENDLVVETPENKPAPRRARRPRTTKPVEKAEESTPVENSAQS